jgi:hypothetical protein
MDIVDKATNAVRLALISLDHKTAPRYDKDKIEQARADTSEGLLLALDLLNSYKMERK